MLRSLSIDNRLTIVLSWAILLIASLLVWIVSEDQKLALPFLHAVLEAVAALLALIISWHSFTTYVASPRESHRLWVGLAFMHMGIFLAFHALVPKGDLSIWFRTCATLVAGMFSLLVWLPNQVHPKISLRSILIICMMVYPLMGVFSMRNQDHIPHMLDHFNMTWIAQLLSVIGGASFIGSGIWFLRHRKYSSHVSHWQSVLQVSSYTFIGFSEILSGWSTTWDPLWWWCHIVRLLSFTFMAYIAKVEFESGLVQHANRDMQIQENARFRLFVESAPCSMLMVEPDGTITMVNHRLKAMFGYGRSEIIGQSIQNLVPQRFRNNGWLIDVPYSGAEGSSDGSQVRELTGLHKDGKEFPIEVVLSSTEFSFGIKLLVIVVDLTERKRTENVLRESKAQFKALAEGAPVGIFQCDKEGFVTYANQRLIDMIGVTSQDEVRTRWGYSLHPEDRDRVLALWANTVKTGHAFRSEHRFVHADGSIVWVLGEGSTVHEEDGAVIGVVGTLTDVTEDKLKEAQFRLVVEAAPCGMLMINTEGQITLVNAQIEALFGYSRSDLIGHHIETLIPVRFRHGHGEMRKGFSHAPYTRPMGLGRYLFGLRKNGTEFPVEVGLNPIQIEGGVNVLATVVDITERTRVEQQLEQQAEDLTRSNHELEQFAYVASHDLQEPLRMVSSYCELLSRRYKGKIDQDADEFIDFAVDGAKRMKTLIDDLLTYSRTGRQTEEFTAIDATESVRAAISNLQITISEAEAVVHCDPLPTVMADSTQLIQVFQNLIGNAIKFRGKQSPTIRISAREISGDSGISHWQFSIQDNGIGFDQQYCDQVFIIFQRLHTRAEHPGNGLGLAIVKKIVERHGGRIWVESTPGIGTTFFFSLRSPLAANSAAA